MPASSKTYRASRMRAKLANAFTTNAKFNPDTLPKSARIAGATQTNAALHGSSARATVARTAAPPSTRARAKLTRTINTNAAPSSSTRATPPLKTTAPRTVPKGASKTNAASARATVSRTAAHPSTTQAPTTMGNLPSNALAHIGSYLDPSAMRQFILANKDFHVEHLLPGYADTAIRKYAKDVIDALKTYIDALRTANETDKESAFFDVTISPLARMRLTDYELAKMGTQRADIWPLHNAISLPGRASSAIEDALKKSRATIRYADDREGYWVSALRKPVRVVLFQDEPLRKYMPSLMAHCAKRWIVLFRLEHDVADVVSKLAQLLIRSLDGTGDFMFHEMTINKVGYTAPSGRGHKIVECWDLDDINRNPIDPADGRGVLDT